MDTRVGSTVFIIYLFLLLPRRSVQELSLFPASPNGQQAQPQRGREAPRPESLTMPNLSLIQASNDQVSALRRLGLLPQVTSGNVTLKDLADDIGRLEGNLASLMQSFLALQRSVFNLEQLQELLVLLLEDILKQTGNMDKSAKGRATGSISSSYDVSSSSKTDDGVDSAEIDEAGEDAEDGNGDAQGEDGDMEDDKLDDRSTRDDRAAGGDNINKNQGGTDPYDNMLHSGIPREINTHPQMGTPFAESQQQSRPTTHNRISHDSDGGSSGDVKSGSDEEEGGARMADTNSVLTKGPVSNKEASAKPRHPQLSEPLVSMTSQLEARLNDMIRRLNPSGIRHGHQRLGNIRMVAGEQQHLSHLAGESPLAPKPVFEPVEVLTGGSDGNSAYANGKVALQSQGVKVKQRIPVVSHGGPLVGPEDFSSPFMERLDVMSSKGESLNEQSTGMISNMMHKAHISTGPVGISEQDANHLQTTPSTTTYVDQAYPTATTTTTMAISQDFDEMIATLLQDLSEHLRKQSAYGEKQSKTNDVIDQAVIELSKLTWIEKPTEKDPTARPEYMVHIAAANIPPSSKLDDDQILDNKNSQATVPYPTKSIKSLDGKKNPADLQGVAADRMLSTRIPHVQLSTLSPVQTSNAQGEAIVKGKSHSLTEADTSSSVNPPGPDQNPSTRQWDRENNVLGIWDWLKYYEQGNTDLDTSLALLIELLSELSSEEHNTSRELEAFSNRGQKITKSKIKSEISATEIRHKSDNTDININTLDAGISNNDKGETSKGVSNDSSESQINDSSEEYMEDLIEGKRPSDHLNSLFTYNKYTNEDNNNIVSYNESDSSSSEEDQSEDISSVSDSKESDNDNISYSSYQRDNPLEKGQDNKVKKEENPNSAPLKQDSITTTEKSDIKTEYTNSGNDEPKTQNIQKLPIKDAEFGIYNREDLLKENINQFHRDGHEGQSDSEESETLDSEDDDYEYMDTNRIRQETQLFSPLVPGDQARETLLDNMPALFIKRNHFITKRNIKKTQNPDTLSIDSTRKMLKPKRSRKKRQAEAFWQQFLGYGLNPAAQQGIPGNHSLPTTGDVQSPGYLAGHSNLQQHGNPQIQDNLQSAGNLQNPDTLQGQGLQNPGYLQGYGNVLSHGNFQSHAHPQGRNGIPSHGIFHAQRPLHGQGTIQNEYLQPQNQPNQIGPNHRRPLQQPILPFRGYPQYSRYNYFGGHNYPHFGYPGYPGMNHEPGESPTFEAGPSADMMEEVLNNLFQQYWENVRNMLAAKGPSTTPEYEYEGPITTTLASPMSTTAAAITTTTTTRKPAVLKTSTTKPSLMTISTKNRNISATTQSLLINIANTTTVNATTAVNSTRNEAPDAQSPVGQGNAFDSSTPLDPLAQVFQNIGTDKNTALPPNFFQRRPLTKTSPYPFF